MHSEPWSPFIASHDQLWFNVQGIHPIALALALAPSPSPSPAPSSTALAIADSYTICSYYQADGRSICWNNSQDQVRKESRLVTNTQPCSGESNLVWEPNSNCMPHRIPTSKVKVWKTLILIRTFLPGFNWFNYRKPEVSQDAKHQRYLNSACSWGDNLMPPTCIPTFLRSSPCV